MAVSHLWDWFWTLNQRRGGGFGPAAISFTEVASWEKLMRTHIEPWEVQALMDMDAAYLEASGKISEK